MDKIVPSFGPFAGGTVITVVLSDAEGFDTNKIAVTMETNDQKFAACTNVRYERLESCYNAQLSYIVVKVNSLANKTFLS